MLGTDENNIDREAAVNTHGKAVTIAMQCAQLCLYAIALVLAYKTVDQQTIGPMFGFKITTETSVWVWMGFVILAALTALLYFVVATFLLFERPTGAMLRPERCLHNGIIRFITAVLNPVAWTALQYGNATLFMASFLMVWLLYIVWDVLVLTKVHRNQFLLFDLAGFFAWLLLTVVWRFWPLNDTDKPSISSFIVYGWSLLLLVINLAFWIFRWFDPMKSAICEAFKEDPVPPTSGQISTR
jgi:hypothetical protein